MTWSPTKERLRGHLMLAAYALLANEALAWVLSIDLIAIYPGLQRWWFIVFGAVTTPAVMIWLCVDAKEAYELAKSRHHLGFEGTPPRVTSIADDCSRRWLVLLHIQMHPELRWRER